MPNAEISAIPIGKPSDDLPSGDPSGSGAKTKSWANRFQKYMVEAKKVAYDIVPQMQGGDLPSAEAAHSAPVDVDVENGSASSWNDWAKGAASKVKTQVTEAVRGAGEGTKQAVDRAKGAELGKHAKSFHSELAKGLGRITDGASQATSAISESSKKAAVDAKDKAKTVKDKAGKVAGKAAGSAKAVAATGAGKVTKGVSGLRAMVVSPAKLAQFGGVFLLGIFLVSMSFSYLPLLPVSPQKFALLFSFGSMTLLGSFAILRGLDGFAKGLLEKKKLPFSASYAAGLIGTLVATILMRSYLLTAVFAVLQAVALLYFLASYVPGGQALL
eukprot:CAMPEP_0172748354 /NCGR_PEP_ID=MMETSP1074-20121228/144864_1 /TAXON_ID=2916 /ORGANISM="Ceratium fusus, Strain PA161109" /LENGTH=328 /DNA_ID=CAMNT_0013580075 /DNA_START=33 /DNA_END=1016 /DNA_ORIENTATION=-